MCCRLCAVCFDWLKCKSGSHKHLVGVAVLRKLEMIAFDRFHRGFGPKKKETIKNILNISCSRVQNNHQEITGSEPWEALVVLVQSIHHGLEPFSGGQDLIAGDFGHGILPGHWASSNLYTLPNGLSMRKQQLRRFHYIPGSFHSLDSQMFWNYSRM